MACLRIPFDIGCTLTNGGGCIWMFDFVAIDINFIIKFTQWCHVKGWAYTPIAIGDIVKLSRISNREIKLNNLIMVFLKKLRKLAVGFRNTFVHRYRAC